MTKVLVTLPHHDCDKPIMTTREIGTFPNGFWRSAFRMKEETFVYFLPKAQEARWTCACGAVWDWEWNKFLDEGRWRIVSRPRKKTEWREV